MSQTVYLVKIGKHIKVGFSTNLDARLKSFQTTSVFVDLLLAIPGDRSLEKTLHRLLDEIKVARELFHDDWRIRQFIQHVEFGGLDRGLAFLQTTTPEARSRKKVEDRSRRTAEARKTKAEKDAYFASLVADRVKRLGW